jgi:hypothetical protein
MCAYASTGAGAVVRAPCRYARPAGRSSRTAGGGGRRRGSGWHTLNRTGPSRLVPIFWRMRRNIGATPICRHILSHLLRPEVRVWRRLPLWTKKPPESSRCHDLPHMSSLVRPQPRPHQACLPPILAILGKNLKSTHIVTLYGIQIMGTDLFRIFVRIADPDARNSAFQFFKNLQVLTN